jgi:hypothetical protein
MRDASLYMFLQSCRHLLGWAKDGVLIDIKHGAIVAVQEDTQGFSGALTLLIYSDVQQAAGYQ